MCWSMRALLSSCESSLMPMRRVRANLEKSTSIRFSHEPCVGVKMNSKRLGTVAR